VHSYSEGSRTTIIGVSDDWTVIDVPGSGVTMMSTSRDPIYSWPFVSGPAPAYGPAPHAVGSLDRFTLQRQFRYPVDGIVFRGSAHAHPYMFVHPQAYDDGHVGFSAPAEAPIHSGIGAAVHHPLNGWVQPAIAVPARVTAHPSSTSQQNIGNAQVHVRFPAPVGMAVQPMSANSRTVVNAHGHASIRATDDTGPNPNSASEQNGTNAMQPGSKSPITVEEKQRRIRWSQLFETDKIGITNSAIRAMPRGILRHGQCNLSGETPGFDLELQFQGRQYIICFQARKLKAIFFAFSRIGLLTWSMLISEL
jgi:hypothetical protein